MQIMQVLTHQDRDDGVRTTGFVLKAIGSAAEWGSKKQTATVTSVVEAEFFAACHALKEAVWLTSVLVEIARHPILDTPGCIQSPRNPVNSKFTIYLSTPSSQCTRQFNFTMLVSQHLSVRLISDTLTQV
jgi:hypothetical protein